MTHSEQRERDGGGWDTKLSDDDDDDVMLVGWVYYMGWRRGGYCSDSANDSDSHCCSVTSTYRTSTSTAAVWCCSFWGAGDCYINSTPQIVYSARTPIEEQHGSTF